MMMEKDSEVPRCRVFTALLSTEDSNNSQKRNTCLLFTQPLLIQLLFLRWSDNRGLLYKYNWNVHATANGLGGH